MTNQEFILLRDFIYEKAGIYFAENKVYLLESRLAGRIEELGLSSFEEYHYYLKYGGQKTAQELICSVRPRHDERDQLFQKPPPARCIQDDRAENLREWMLARKGG